MKLEFWSGTLDDTGHWSSDGLGSDWFVTPAKDSYIVHQVRAMQGPAWYGLRRIHRGREDYEPHCDTRSALFAVQPGEVVYLGDVDLDVRRDANGFWQTGISQHSNLELARRWLAMRYPRLAPRLVSGSFRFARIAC